MTELQSHPEGVILCVRALPGARRDELRGWQEGHLKVAVTQIAEKGKANKALQRVLAEALRLRKSQIRLLSGETSADKRWLVAGVTVEELDQRLEAAGCGRHVSS